MGNCHRCLHIPLEKKIDFSYYPNLHKFECFDRIDKLHVSNSANLTHVSCKYIGLSVLSLSNCPNVFHLECNNNELTELDLSNYPNLLYLECHNNQLTKLDISNCPNLKKIVCYNNQIRELDVSNCCDLTTLECWDNEITELDISQNDKLEFLWSSNNPFRNHFDYDIDHDTNKYRQWCKENYTYHNDIMLK